MSQLRDFDAFGVREITRNRASVETLSYFKHCLREGSILFASPPQYRIFRRRIKWIFPLLETWSDWSKSHYIKENHGEKEETAGDAVNNQSRGGVGEDVVRHVGVTSSEQQQI